MSRWMRRCLKSSSLALLCLAGSCASPYRSLKPAGPPVVSAARYQPVFEKALYRCVVDGRFFFRRFRLSGVLLLKRMPDHTTRAVFQNEMGFSFFDFEWDDRDSFKVNRVIPQLDKPAVIATLEKDLRLLLMKGLDYGSEQYYRDDAATWHRFTLDKGYAWYVEENNLLTRIENSGKRRVITMGLSGPGQPGSLPGGVLIRHHRAGFTIQLHKINQDASE